MTAAQSLINISVAAFISTAMVGVGIYGRAGKTPADKRRINWLWMLAGLGGVGFAFYVANAELRFAASGTAFVFIVAGTLGGLLIGTGLLRRGLRGRQVGDHPHCRTCGFNLFGRPDGVNRCSECGAELDEKGAIVIGVRQRRMGLLLAGVFLLILSLSLGVGVTRTVAQSGSFNVSRYKPTWMLLRQASVGGNVRRQNYEADRELVARSQSGKLNAEEVRSLVKIYLADTDPMKWQTYEFGVPLVIRAWMQNLLPDDECQSLLDQMNTLQVFPRSATPQVMNLELFNDAEFPFFRAKTSTVKLVSVRIDSTELQAIEDTSSLFTKTSSMGKFYTLRLSAPLSVGEHQLEIVWDLVAPYTAPGKSPILINKRVTTKSVVSIVPAAELACAPMDDPGFAVRYPTEVKQIDAQSQITINNPSKVAFLGRLDLINMQTGDRQTLGPVYLDDYGNGAQFSTGQRFPGSFELELVPTPERGEEIGRVIETYQKPVRIAGADLVVERDKE